MNNEGFLLVLAAFLPALAACGTLVDRQATAYSAMVPSPGECLNSFGLTVEYEASPGCISLRGESIFESSLSASIDSFFALYRSNPNDPRLLNLMTEVNDIAINFVYDKIGLYPIYILEPDPDKLAILSENPELSEWREAQGGDTEFQSLLRIDSKYDETSRYRWRLLVSPSIFYDPSLSNNLAYRTVIYLDLQSRCLDCSSFAPVTLVSNDKLKSYLDNMRGELRDEYKAFLKRRWSVELLEVNET